MSTAERQPKLQDQQNATDTSGQAPLTTEDTIDQYSSHDSQYPPYVDHDLMRKIRNDPNYLKSHRRTKVVAGVAIGLTGASLISYAGEQAASAIYSAVAVRHIDEATKNGGLTFNEDGSASVTLPEKKASVDPGDPEALVNPETFSQLVNTLHTDMPDALPTMKGFLSAEDSAKVDLDLPSDFTKFTGKDYAKYLSVATYTATVESKDGKNIDIEMARDILSVVIAKNNPAFQQISDSIDGVHGDVSVLEAVGIDFPRLEGGTEFLDHTMPKDGGQIVKLGNDSGPGYTYSLFEVVDINGEKTPLYVDNYASTDTRAMAELDSKFGHH